MDSTGQQIRAVSVRDVNRLDTHEARQQLLIQMTGRSVASRAIEELLWLAPGKSNKFLKGLCRERIGHDNRRTGESEAGHRRQVPDGMKFQIWKKRDIGWQ